MRDDFLKPTIRILADRVNSICSNPTCKAQTRARHSADQKAINIGKAAHITAAASNGPRYDPTLTSEERRHFSNGIWLCANCADLIDSDPLQFTVELLRKWKDDAETNAIIDIGRPRGFSKGKLATMSAAVPFGTETNVQLEDGRIVPKAHIFHSNNPEQLPTYFDSFGFIRKFKIKKRPSLKHIVLDDIRAIVHVCHDIPKYRQMFGGAYPTKTSLFTVTLKPPASGEAQVCYANRYYEIKEGNQFDERRFNSLIIDDDMPHEVIIRFNAEKPGYYFVSLRVVLSRGMKYEEHIIMSPSPIIFENEPVFDD